MEAQTTDFPRVWWQEPATPMRQPANSAAPSPATPTAVPLPPREGALAGANLPPALLQQQARLAALEGVIERCGMRYLGDLWSVSEELGRLYGERLATKDAQIAVLAGRAEAAERQRDRLAAHVRELSGAVERYYREVQAWSEQAERAHAEESAMKDAEIAVLRQRAGIAEWERDALAGRNAVVNHAA